MTRSGVSQLAFDVRTNANYGLINVLGPRIELQDGIDGPFAIYAKHTRMNDHFLILRNAEKYIPGGPTNSPDCALVGRSSDLNQKWKNVSSTTDIAFLQISQSLCT